MGVPLESTIRECSGGLKSARAKERKKCADNLKDFLSQNNASALLSENTLKGNGFNWTDIFNDISEFILKESESSKTYDSAITSLSSSLLDLCVAGSIKGKAYVRCEELMDTTLTILKDSRLARVIGDAYLSLLYKHVLQNEHYQNMITPSNWEDLIEICIQTCLTNNSKLDDFTKLRLVYLAMRNCTKCCQLIIPLRDSLSQLKTCFARVMNDIQVQEVIMDIVTLLLEILSSECRLCMCEFIESMMTSFLTFYDQNFDEKKKSSLFKLLSLAVALHHPQGKLQHQECSLAHDWTIWNKSLSSILEIISIEASFLQKVSKTNDDLHKECANFYTVSAATYFLVFNMSKQTEDNDRSNKSSSKRKMTQPTKNKCFSDIVDELRQNHIPWLGIIEMYLQKYAYFVLITDAVALLNVIEQILANNNNFADWDTLQSLACMALKRLERRKCDAINYDEILLSLWNLCVRNSTSSTGIFKVTHSIMQLILRLDTLQYAQVQPLINQYFENGMLVTDSSVVTLKTLFHKFFNKFSLEDKRLECIAWLIQGDITSVGISYLRDFLLQVLSNDNVKIDSDIDLKHDFELNDIFESVEKCILFSEFDIKYSEPKPKENQPKEALEINSNMNKRVCDNMIEKVLYYSKKLNQSEVNTSEYLKIVNIALSYIDINLKHEGLQHEYLKNTEIYRTLNKASKQLFATLVSQLQSNKQITEKNAILKSAQAILISDYDPLINTMIRDNIGSAFISCLNSIMCSDNEETEDVVEVDLEYYSDSYSLKYSCTSVLSSYCRTPGSYRGEVLDHILDAKSYDFNAQLDIECAFNCIDLLSDSNLENRPIEPICTLLQNMCISLFRDSDAMYRILKKLLRLLDQIWNHESADIKTNCYIMIESYMLRCEQSYYSPKVAALVYECATKLTELNNKFENSEFDTEIFTNSVIEKIKGPLHNIRLICSYLVKSIVTEQTEIEIDLFLNNLSDIFEINVSQRNPLILKDESVNRTLTLLHNMYSLVEEKNSLLHKTILTTLQLQKEKSLDNNLVQKVLNIITTKTSSKKLSCYLNDNLPSIINFWFTKQNSIDELPIDLFELEKTELIKKHIDVLLPAETLWLKNGNIHESTVFTHLIQESGNSRESIIESCFCRATALCLPYIVTNEYSLPFKGQETKSDFIKSSENAFRLFQSIRETIGTQKWSQLFLDNIGDLVLQTAYHFRDPIETEERFKVNMLHTTETNCYPKSIFTAILKYFGKLIDGNIMQYLCKSQPNTMFKILSGMWQDVVNEKVLANRILALNTFITFVEECVPLDYPSDAFVCNFVCNSLANAIKASKTSLEMKSLAHALWISLQKFLPDKVDILRKSVSSIMSILLVKKEEGYAVECSIVWDYLSVDMKHYLKDGEYVIDFIQSTSQRVEIHMQSASRSGFLEVLKTYETSLSYPSHEVLSNLRNFVMLNKDYFYKSAEEPDRRAVENCGVGLVHEVISSLCNILKSASDYKTIIDTCNCLAEIGFYDLKTLVTIPPGDTQRVVDMKPSEYLTYIVVKELSEILFDENPLVTNNIANTLTSLFKYREGFDILELFQVDIQMLKPFSTSSKHTPAEFIINREIFENYNSSGFWVTKDEETHAEWVTRVTVDILDVLSTINNYMEVLKNVCVLKPCVCENILPPLVGLLLMHASESQVKTLSGQLNNYFVNIWKETFENSEEMNIVRRNKTLDHEQKMVVQTLLEVINLVRLQRNHYKPRPYRTPESLNYLRLEYDKVAWAATMVDQFLVALYYGELWAVGNNDGVPPSSPEATTLMSGGVNVQRIFRKCYLSIGEMDAIEGCGTAHLTSEEKKCKHLINTRQYADALLMHDIALSSGHEWSHNEDLQYGVVKSLYKSGMYQLALQYIKSLPESDELSGMKYDCLSFLGDWSEFVDTIELDKKSQQKHVDPNSVIKAYHYTCLKDCLNMQATRDSDTKMILNLNRAKLAISKLCQDLNMANCQNVYKVVGKLHLFRDIEDYFAVRRERSSIQEVLYQWQVSKLPPYRNFKHIEAMISQRCLILEYAAETFGNSVKDIITLQLEYTKLCVGNHNTQMAQRLLAAVKKMDTSKEISLVEGELSWEKGDRGIALSIIRDIVTNSNVDESLVTAISLRQYGNWIAETKSDNARNIIDKYLKESLKLLNKDDHAEIKLKVYYDIARFADAEYKQVVNYMNSSVFENKVKRLETSKGAASSQQSQSQQALNRDEKRASVAPAPHVRFKDLDEIEIADTKAEKESFLHLALKYYLLSLRQGEDNNLSVFRVILLWFDNPSIELNEADSETFEDLLHSIPSRKFITVLPQLAARLTYETTPFAENLRRLIKRCATEHPHHTLPILFSLKNLDKDKLILNTSQSERNLRAKVVEPRVPAAELIIKQVSKESKEMAVIVAQMEKMCDAMISFANYQPKSKVSMQRIPPAELINKLTNLDAIPIATVTVPVREDCTYYYLTSLLSFETYFELVGGINCPKKIICKSSDGKRRTLLVKGEDDLRQDALIQQVFNIVNMLLEKDPITSRNKLLVRTHKVVPMSRRSGVLEWCEETLPLGSYLAGSAGAHTRYRPKDITPYAARVKLQQCHDQRQTNKEKFAVFTKILRALKPVFHYFFTENYLDPVTWYERRLAYTKSVSTSSMVGYMLGIGDRHIQNILIDRKTAEVIHIDFGVAFDQGKALPTPETVPFRLTQDMIAGFGSCGVEGLFRKYCEKTMQLLRDNSENLLTIFEVLLYDPLYPWTISSQQNKDTSMQYMTGPIGSLAKRALLTVSRKLSGTEGGTAGEVAVSGQVARLLAAAVDPANLCRLFPGWQPYL